MASANGRGRSEGRGGGRGRGDGRGRGRGATPMPEKLPAAADLPANGTVRVAAAAPSSSIDEGVEDPYDPAEPNDYVAMHREREQRRAQDRRERQRQLQLERMEKEHEERLRKREESTAPVAESSGLSHLPAWVKAESAPSQSKDSSSPAAPIRSRVLLLKNMAGSLDADLEKETKAECEKVGPVESCAAEMSEDGEVRIYVRFSKKSDALKAFVTFEGRFFAGRKISCAFVAEA